MVTNLVNFIGVIVSVALLFASYASSAPTDDDFSVLSRIGYYASAPLESKLSSDGMTLYNGRLPIVYVMNPASSSEPVRIPAPFDLLRLPESATATFSITYVSDGGTDLWGERCYTFPSQAQTAFSAAADIWANIIQSSVPITIRTCWANLGPSSILGYSGGSPLQRDFSGAPRASTWYSGSLANALAGSDLDPSSFDMHITYNSNFTWYYGTDGNTPAGLYDLMSVVLHEIAHGLNFGGSMDYSGGSGNWGYGTAYPDIYDTFVRDGSGNQLINTAIYPNPSTTLGSALTSNNIWFHGANAVTANGGVRVKIYAPSRWNEGSSYSHLDYATFNNTSNQLMVYAISSGESVHDPGSVTIGLLQDLGWQTGSPSPGPDLIETSVSNPPASAFKGTSFSATDTVKNRGAASAIASITSYYLSLDTVRDSGDILLTGSRAVPSLGSGGTDTGTITVTIPLSSASGSYYLLACADDTNLIAENNENNNCIASASRINVSVAPPGPPTLVSPSGTIVTTTPTYTWNAVSNATDYYLWVNDSSGNRIQQWYTAAACGCGSGTGTCSVTPPTTLNPGAGQWWVQAKNSGGTSPWSAAMSFAIPLGAATPLSPAPSSTITTATPPYTWAAVSAATWYYLSVDDPSGNRILQWYAASAAGCGSGTGNCSVTPTTVLYSGACKWKVQTWNSSYGYGPWSTLVSFTVNVPQPPIAPTLVFPSGTIMTTTPTYTWNAVSNATDYYLWVNDSSGNRIQQWYSAAASGCGSGTGTCSVTPATTLNSGAGQWWVEAKNALGYSPWSTPLSFTVGSTSGTPGAATLISPNGSIATNTPTYNWNAVLGSTWYYLWVNDYTGNRIATWYTAAAVGCSTGTGMCSVTPATTLASGPAKWWIETWNSYGAGPWSAPMNFTVP